MHFFYIDEAGCTGADLDNAEQPVFVAGGIVVRDEGWNKTSDAFEAIVRDYFDNEVPATFELHSHHLFSPLGSGPFTGHAIDRRATLAHAVLNLIAERKHHTCYLAIDKNCLKAVLNDPLPSKNYLPRRAPYTIAYDNLISSYEWFAREKLGRSARGMVIVDTKVGYESDIASTSLFRRRSAPAAQRIKLLTEFTYAIDSHKNPMVQISDLVCFVSKKFCELDAGYKDHWNAKAKSLYRDLYAKVHDRLIRKKPNEEMGRHSIQYNGFMDAISICPKAGFRTRVYG